MKHKVQKRNIFKNTEEFTGVISISTKFKNFKVPSFPF